MTRSHTIAVLPGDGIGPEVTSCALEVLDAAEARYGFTTQRTHYAAGANHYLETGELFPAIETELRGADAILFGSMGD
ncbi:MAG: 3-isopropylmalate dehydrogenase, partial [Leucobacter sp.]|nr:3-isopropylmalate dehydrogenase [Leucobacter sp.]